MAVVAVASTLCGCGSLPLTPATAPLAIAFWGAIVDDFFGKWKEPAAPVLMHAEAGPTLTPDALAVGVPGSDLGPVPESGTWLAQRGLTTVQLANGDLMLARIGWTVDAPDGHRSVDLPVLRGEHAAPAGSLMAIRISPSEPIAVVGVLATSLAEAGCADQTLPDGAATAEQLNGRSLGSPRLRAVLACPSLHTPEWQRAALFWHQEPRAAWRVQKAGPEMPRQLDVLPGASPAAQVAVYRNRSVTADKGQVPLFIDGRPVDGLGNGQCRVFALVPGTHRVMTGTGGFFGSPRRTLDVRLPAGGQAAVEFVVDDAVNNNLLLGVTNYRSYEERAFRLVQRPMLTAISRCPPATSLSPSDAPSQNR